MKKKTAKAAETMSLESKNQPAFTKAVKNIKKSIAAKKEEGEVKYKRGVIMVSHLPHGFFEDELKGFFSQFGKVLRVRVGRSLKTGRSRGYAFVEFEFEDVARIAAESMNNYLMFERLIKCKVVDEGTRVKNIFAQSNVRADNYPTLNRRNDLKAQQSVPLTDGEVEKLAGNRLKTIAKHNAKLSDLGLVYQFEDDEPPVPEKFVRKSAPYKPVKKLGVLSKTIKKAEKKKKSTTPAREKTPVVTERSPKPKTPKTPKTPKLEQSSVIPEKKTPKKSPVVAEKKPLTPTMEETPVVPDKKRKSVKAEKKVEINNKFSPKLLRSRARQSDISDLKSLASAKVTPKAVKGGRKSLATTTVVKEEDEPAVPERFLRKSASSKPVKKPGVLSKTPKTPKTPKIEQSPVIPEKKTPKKSPVNAEKKPLTPTIEETPVVPEKTRKSVKAEKKVEIKNKFSPKLLRSRARQSDISDLKSLASAKVTPKVVKGGRKSLATTVVRR